MTPLAVETEEVSLAATMAQLLLIRMAPYLASMMAAPLGMTSYQLE